MGLREKWEAHADEWIAWTRTPGHDSYDKFHRDQFLALVPAPGRATLDVGCGEGRLTRHLAGLGHRIAGIDGSPKMIAAATALSPDLELRVADAAALPLADGSFDLVVAFMSLHDVDDLEGAVREIARVLEPGGRLCLAIVHPLNSAGRFEKRDRFVIADSYLSEHPYEDRIERGGLTMTFASQHRPLAAFFLELERNGFLTEALREPPSPDPSGRWQRLPLFLHLRAVKNATKSPAT